MFKHILMPTDGSAIAKKAIHNGMAFAKEIGAQVTGFHVMPVMPPYAYQAEMLADTQQRFDEECLSFANSFLAEVTHAATKAGVKCDTFCVTSDAPYQQIIQAAQDSGCDLIAMASHGRSGIEDLFLGSQTQKVLTHSQIPVLVYR
jgi:nucleotide-binding universal stress UspA family protein